MNTNLQELVSLSPDPIIGVDSAGTVNLFNLAAQRLLGYSSSEVLHKLEIKKVYPSVEHARQINKLMYASPDGQIEGFETQLLSKAQRVVDIRLSARLLSRDGEPFGSIGFFHDMTERKRLESILQQMSITDNLTGLFNQRHFRAVLETELERASRYGRPLCLVCIDIDNFKQVNDKLGHLEGDNALRLTARTLQNLLRKTDVAFRSGGDEFVLLLPETGNAEAQAIAARLKDSFDQSWAKEWAAKPGCASVGLSMGVAEFAQNETADALIRRADESMYETKRNRR